MAKLIIIFAFLPLTLFGQKTFFIIPGCDTVLTHVADTVLLSCNCVYLDQSVFFQHHKLRLDLLSKYAKVELPKRTGQQARWYYTVNNTLTVMYASMVGNTVSTRVITWKYDHLSNRFSIVNETYKEYKR